MDGLSESQECPLLTILRLWEGNPAVSHQKLPTLYGAPQPSMARSARDPATTGDLDITTPHEKPLEIVQHVI